MESWVEDALLKKGYRVNHNAQAVIRTCDDWYSDRVIGDFHCRRTLQGVEYELNRLNFAKRCCSDDAKLCEVVEIHAGAEGQSAMVNDILAKNEFGVQYRKQLEKTSAVGTAACYVRLDNADIYSDGSIRNGSIRLNYVDADCFIPLTVVNDIVTEAAFSGSSLKGGRKQTTLVLFLLSGMGTYTAETHIFDEYGCEQPELTTIVSLGDVKPFAVMRNAEVNNLDDMTGYGLPKLVNAIPVLKVLDLCYNVLFSDLDKAEKIILVNEILCESDPETGKPRMTPEQKKIFMLIGEKLPEQKEVLQEYNPIIRIDEITKSFELALSLLSMNFGYGTKKYSFENGQITTATEYIGERQDQMQELNRQRQEAEKYIRDICRAVIWYSNRFHGTNYDDTEEILVDFDDSYVTDRETELERVRNDALQFDIPRITIWYLMKAYSLTEEEAAALVEEGQMREEELEKDEESEDLDMLTDRQMEYISDVLVPLFQYLESEVIADVAERVKATMAFTRTAELEAQALHELGYSPAYIRKEVMKKLNADPEYRKLVAKNTLVHKRTVKKLLREIQREAYRAGEKLFAQSGNLSFLDDLRIWKLGNKEITDGSFLPKLVKAMEMQTMGELRNLTRTTGFRTMAGMESLQTVYRKELDQAMIKITTGTFSQEKVVYDVIHNLAHSGLRTVDYGTGRTMQLDSAVRLAVRTGTHQLMGKIAEQNIRETETDMVYVSSHWGARNTGQGHANHAEWQGKVYMADSSLAAGDAAEEAGRIGQAEIKELWEATGYCMDGTHENDPRGLYGYNCRHRIYPWFRGVSTLPDEDPEPEPVTIDGKQYDYYAMSQKQRAMEGRIRALKREREAMQKLGMDTKEVQKKIKDRIREYEQFCKDYNMPEKYNRIRYDSGTGEYKKTRAWKEYEEKHKADMERAGGGVETGNE